MGGWKAILGQAAPVVLLRNLKHKYFCDLGLDKGLACCLFEKLFLEIQDIIFQPFVLLRLSNSISSKLFESTKEAKFSQALLRAF